MERDIDIRSEILKLGDQVPFHPFTIIMDSGWGYEVSEPIALVMLRAAILLVPPKGQGTRILRISRISSINIGEAE